jgi:ATP-dependent DNA ligase
MGDAGAGIRLCEHIEGTDAAVVFRAACSMGLEGIVAKCRDSRYRSGRSRDWIKIKNRNWGQREEECQSAFLRFSRGDALFSGFEIGHSVV